MSEVLQVTERNELGKRHTRRLRRAGFLPAVLYGKGNEARSLSVPAEQVAMTVRHGSKLVELQGSESGTALIQELQWDTFSTHVLHLDLLRVDATERVSLTVPVEIRGSAPGEKEGGVVEHLLHELEIEATVQSLVDRIEVSVNELQVNQSMTIGDLQDVPDGVTIVTDAKTTVVQCMVPIERPDEDDVAAATGAEPELIGRKESEEEDDS